MIATALVLLSASPSIALTFDDGPGRHTPAILNSLRASGARGTFFVLGWRLRDRRWKGYLRDIARQGHRIGNHLWSHRQPCQMTRAQLLREFRRTQARLPLALCGRVSRCALRKAIRWVYRPPHGQPCHQRAVRALGYRVRYWDASDYRRGKAGLWRKLQQRMRWRRRTGRPLRVTALFHQSPSKLRYILAQAKRAGWRFTW